MPRNNRSQGTPAILCTPTKRKAILIYHDLLGKSFKWIAKNAEEFKDTHTTHTTISHNYCIAKERGCYSYGKKTGRPRVLSSADLDKAVEAVDNGSATDGADVQRQLFSDRDVSTRTVQRNLGERDRKGYVRQKKFALSPLHIAKRFAFARTWSDWADPQVFAGYTLVISDESKFSLDGSDGLRWCRRPRGQDALDVQNVSQRVRRGLGSGKVNVWGCITPDGVGHLYRIDGNMDRFQYTHILESALLPTIEMHGYANRRWMFQQDNDSKHTSIHAREWFDDHGIHLLKWPPNSPDMSPIENLWDYLEKQVKKRGVLPQNPDELWDMLREEWYKPAFNRYAKELYSSMPRRIQALLDAKGRWTKY